MSVLTEAYAVPSRLIGVYRYLLRCRGQKENADLIDKLLAPESLIRTDDREGQSEREGGGCARSSA